MPNGAKPLKWFYQSAKTNEEEGPFNLVELAGFLAAGDITAETPTRREDEDAWLPFQDRREFRTAKDIPMGVIMRHLDHEKEERDEKTALTPKHVLYFFWFLGGLALYILSLIFFPYNHRHDSNEWLLTLMRVLNWHASNGGS